MIFFKITIMFVGQVGYTRSVITHNPYQPKLYRVVRLISHNIYIYKKNVYIHEIQKMDKSFPNSLIIKGFNSGYRFLWCTNFFCETWIKTEFISCEHKLFLNPEIILKPSPVNIKFLYWYTPDFHFWCTPNFDVH